MRAGMRAVWGAGRRPLAAACRRWGPWGRGAAGAAGGASARSRVPALAAAAAAGAAAAACVGGPPVVLAEEKRKKRKRTLYVFLVRHAESENNARGHHDDNESAGEAERLAAEKVADPYLTERGVRQAEATARFFGALAAEGSPWPELRPARLCVSPMRRALETCRPLAAAVGLPPEVRLETYERGGLLPGGRRAYGAAGAPLPPPIHGLGLEGMREVLPGAWCSEQLPAEGWWRGGLESDAEMCERASRCSEWLWRLAEDSDGRSGAVVCVAHGFFINVWLQALLGLTPSVRGARLPTANCCFHLLKLEVDASADAPRNVVVAASNASRHLPDADHVPHHVASWRF